MFDVRGDDCWSVGGASVREIDDQVEQVCIDFPWILISPGRLVILCMEVKYFLIYFMLLTP